MNLFRIRFPPFFNQKDSIVWEEVTKCRPYQNCKKMEHSVIQNVNKKLVAYYKSCNRHNFTLFPCRGDKNLFRIQTELNFCCFSNPSDPFSNPKHLCSFNTFLLDNFLKPSLVVSKPLITKLVDIWNSPIRQAFPNYPTRSKCRDSRV